MTSCQKDEITVNLKQSGSLNVLVADSSGNKFNKVKVSIYSYELIISSSNSSLSGAELDEKRTDNNGNISFGELSAGDYVLLADTVKIGAKKYYIVKPVQIISGSTKNIILNPMEYVGTVKINISLITSGIISNIPSLSTLKVALVNYSDYNASFNRQKVISRAVDIQNCDVNGNVVFNNLPSDIPYLAYVYINNTDTIGAWCSNYSEIFFDKDGTYSANYQINLGNIFTIKATAYLNFTYYSNSSNSYVPVKNANVLLVNYNDYYNYSLSYSSLSTILNYKVATGITDNSGNITLSNIPEFLEYYVLIYYNDNYKTWVGYYYTDNNGSYYNFSNISGSSLGLTK